MKIRILLLALLLGFLFSHGSAQTNTTKIFKGVVVDALSNEPIPYATISLINYGFATESDNKGVFTVSIKNFSPAKNSAKVSCVGFKPEIISLQTDIDFITVKLNQQTEELQEVVVKKRRYTNKNNPAVDLIEKVIANKRINKKEALDYIENDKYEKIQFAINHITPEFQKKKMFNRFQFVFENIDTIKNSGMKILPVYLKEELSSNYYQRSPQMEKKMVNAHKVVSFQGFDNQGIEDNIKYLYQNIDIYDNNIAFLTNQFLSPIAGTAPAFYRYYIVDTIQSGAEKYTRMYFGSRNKEDMLFQGYLYISMDGNYAVKKLEMSLNKAVNIDWISDVKIVQEFERAENNSLMLSSDQISMDFSLTKKSRGLYGQKTILYTNYHFNPLSKDDKLLKGPSYQINDSANNRSENYWKQNRSLQLNKSEAGTYASMDSVQKDPAVKTLVNIATVLFMGYEDLGPFEIGPVTTFVAYNPIEGFRYKFGGRTTDKFSKKINLETYAAYGTTDRQLKYYLGGTWSFTNRNHLEFPVKTLKISYQNETELPGQEMQFLMEDNVLVSIKRGVNDKLFYNKTFKVEHLNEFKNHFSYTVGYKFTNMIPRGNLYFNYTNFLAHTNDIGSINVSEFYVDLRYAPEEKFYQGKNYRHTINGIYPTFELRYNIGSKAWGNDYNYQTLRFNIQKRFYFSVLGYANVTWEAGKIFGKVPYPLLNIPQANQSYAYQLVSYNMMNFLEFVTDQYTSLMIDHNFNGFIFNKIPLLKQLNWREILNLKILYGNLTKINDPNQQNDLFKLPVDASGTPLSFPLRKTPYIEGSIGVGNILNIFRVDFVHRFTYLDNPNVSKNGIRLRIKFDF